MNVILNCYRLSTQTNSNLTKERDCMTWLYLVVMMFSALTLFTYGEYKQNGFSKKAFTLVSIMEAVMIIATVVMLIMSFNQFQFDEELLCIGND